MSIFKGNYNLDSKGALLPTVLIVLLFLLSIGLTLTGLALSQLQSTQRGVAQSNSLMAAEAGVEMAIHELNLDDDFAGHTEEQEWFDTDQQGRGTYEVSVEDGDIAEEKIVTSTGRVYAHGSDEASHTSRVRAVIVGTTIQEERAVRAGAGGLILQGNAGISNGPVHVDGRIDMTGNANIGSQSQPVNVDVGYYACPPGGGSDYPRLCTSSDEVDQPISIGGNNHIYGDVCANGQSDSTSMSHGGLDDDCSDVEQLGLPGDEFHDRQAQQDNVEEVYSAPNQGSCGGQQSITWPANLHIQSDVSTGGGCEVTVEGDTWIDGGLSIGANSSVRVSDDAEEPPFIMVDGEDGVDLSSNDGILPNEDGIGAVVITFYSTADCSPDCVNVTGSDLQDSEQIETIRLGANANAPATVFYAKWTEVNMGGNATTGGLIGQVVRMQGTGDVVFGEELSSGEQVWSIVNYQRVFEGQ